MNPIPAWVQRLWDAWDARVLVLLSFTLQIILTILGSRRRYVVGIAGILIRFIVWSAYLGADWVATLGLGKLSEVEIGSNDIVDAKLVLRALWAPMLLLHLGGPDTVTAYSVEDGQLWLRHLLSLVVQLITAIYVILRCWNTKSRLIYLTFPIFLAGTIKYGEKIWALKYSTGKVQFGREEFVEGSRYDLTVRLLDLGYWFFCKLNLHNEICFSKGREETTHDKKWLDIFKFNYEDVFRIAEFEVGFMYDVLYTKAAVIYTLRGCSFRCITLLCSVSALVVFPFAAKAYHENVDIVITYVLLAGTVVQEIYAITLIIYSDWAIISMVSLERLGGILSERVVPVVVPRLLSKQRQRWSNSIGQVNFLSFCLSNDEQSKYLMFSRIIELFGMKEEFEKYWLPTQTNVSRDLKEVIVLRIKRGLSTEDLTRRELYHLTKGGEWARFIEIGILRGGVEFDQCVMVWHIVTDICYCYNDDHDNNSSAQLQRDMSKQLSDYMIYLLVTHPYLLSTPLGASTFYQTSETVREYFSTKGKPSSVREACERLLPQKGRIEPDRIEPRDKMFILLKARELARILCYSAEGKWENISRAWVDMLFYAANRCPVNVHVTPLRRGGEFFTQVWLLLEHMKRGSPLFNVDFRY